MFEKRRGNLDATQVVTIVMYLVSGDNGGQCSC